MVDPFLLFPRGYSSRQTNTPAPLNMPLRNSRAQPGGQSEPPLLRKQRDAAASRRSYSWEPGSFQQVQPFCCPLSPKAGLGWPVTAGPEGLSPLPDRSQAGPGGQLIEGGTEGTPRIPKASVPALGAADTPGPVADRCLASGQLLPCSQPWLPKLNLSPILPLPPPAPAAGRPKGPGKLTCRAPRGSRTPTPSPAALPPSWGRHWQDTWSTRRSTTW